MLIIITKKNLQKRLHSLLRPMLYVLLGVWWLWQKHILPLESPIPLILRCSLPELEKRQRGNSLAHVHLQKQHWNRNSSISNSSIVYFWSIWPSVEHSNAGKKDDYTKTDSSYTHLDKFYKWTAVIHCLKPSMKLCLGASVLRTWVWSLWSTRAGILKNCLTAGILRIETCISENALDVNQ